MKETNNIIGPIDKNTFKFLGDLKSSTELLESYGREDFKEAIRKEKKVYKDTLKSFRD